MKLFNATKKIAAVGAASVIVANAAFAAGLNNYPNNFVEDGKFVGNVVVGSSATADAAAAEALIADLTADLGGDEKVKITYRKSSSSGKELPVMKSNTQINFGENLNLSLEKTLDDSDSSLLEDDQLKKEDYKQELTLEHVQAKFERALETDVDDMDKQEVGIFFDKDAIFAEYKVEFEKEFSVKSADDDDDEYIGEKLTILGKEFVVSNIKGDEITLVGGSNKVSLGESESSTVTIDDKTYDVQVQSVSENKVLVVVNGQSKSVDKYDSEEIAGVNIVVTDVVSSSRDSVKGYAEIVVGGQEIKISHNDEVEVDDEKVSDVYEDYVIDAEILEKKDDTFKGFKLTYRVNEETFLEAGDSLDDVLFNAFSLNFESVDNEGDKAEIKLSASSEDLTIDLVSSKGFEYSLDKVVTASGTDETPVMKLNGKDDEDRFLTGKNFALNALVTSNFTFAAGTGTDKFDVTYDGKVVGNELAVGDNFFVGTKAYSLKTASTTEVIGHYLAFSDDSEGVRFIAGDKDEAVVFEVTSFDEEDDREDDTLTIERISEDGADYEVKKLNIADKLDMENKPVVLGEGIILKANNLQSKLRLENDLEIDFDKVEFDKVIEFTYNADFDADEGEDSEENFKVTLGLDDDDLTLVPSSTAAAWASSAKGGKFDISRNEVEDDSDIKLATSRFGTTVKYDSDEKDSVTIAVPSEQAEAVVSYSTGAVASSTSSAIVDAADVADKKAELEKEGYKIVGTEDVSAVEVEVTAPMTDAEVTEMSNLIVVGGPAVNAVARTLLGVEEYSMEAAGVVAGEAVAKYFADSNSVLVYGYEAADTAAIVEKLVAGEADFE